MNLGSSMLELLSCFFFLSLVESVDGDGASPPAALAALIIGTAAVAVVNIASVKSRIANLIMRLS
jgi:hypothetical protein